MLRSMYSGISGLKNFQTKLDVIGNNIANVNTYGFKKGRVTFKDMMNQTVAGASAATEMRGGTNSKQVGLGSALATIDTIHEGSSLQSTNRALDLGIEGDGYFIVRQGDAQFYTRAGNFYLDDNGVLVNGDGLRVQAYRYNADGSLSNEIGDVTVNVNAVMPATPTANIAFSENLSSDTIANGVFSQTVKVVDTNGIAHVVDIYFQKTATADEWNIYLNQDPNGTPAPTAVDHTITFETDGKIADADVTFSLPTLYSGKFEDDGTTPIEIEIPTGGITLDFSLLTQFKGTSTATVDPDGSTEGKLESFSIGSSGEISGVYSNGEIAALGRIALAKFSNSSGLTKAGGNLFQESINSGTANIGAAGDGRGSLAAGSLEMSNVDLSEEFTDMIVAQRGFQANTRIITTSDEILQELVNLKR